MTLSKAQEASLRSIEVRGCRVHNLKNIDLDIPKMQVTVVCGPSGSGKSSLVWHTIHAEAQRRQLEAFDAYARSRMPKAALPEVDRVSNLAPPVAVEQGKMGANPRSTVGTASELAPLVRLLFSRCGEHGEGSQLLASDFSFNGRGACEKCQGLGTVIDLERGKVIDLAKSLNGGAILHHNFVNQEGVYFQKVSMSGLFDMDLPLKDWPQPVLSLLLDAPMQMQMKEVRKVIDGLAGNARGAKKTASNTNERAAKRSRVEPSYRKTTDPTCPMKTWSGVLSMLRNRLSNSGGKEQKNSAKDLDYFSSQTCPECQGSRLKRRPREATIAGTSIIALGAKELCEVLDWLATLSLCGAKAVAATSIVADLRPRLEAMCSLGLDYLSLDRPSGTLSGGESQRLRLAKQLHCGLTGMLYVLDEPTAGLHFVDAHRIVQCLQALRDGGNTVLVVEHSRQVLHCADHVIEIGPASGSGGGQVVFEGSVEKLCRGATATSRLFTQSGHGWRQTRSAQGHLAVRNVTAHNMKNVCVDFPLGCLVAVTGVSGSGKSTLVHEGLIKQYPDRVVVVDQSGVGRSNLSNLATYADAFDGIRAHFQQKTGKNKSLFSFNSDGGCEQCNGHGTLSVEMMFMNGATAICPSCRGSRFCDRALEPRVQGKNIADVLALTVDEACTYFSAEATIKAKLGSMQQVGLGYLRLGQSLSTLSGGEAQRLKLAAGLNKKAAFYVLDEVTTGLHQQDVATVMNVLHRLVDEGVGIVLVEHNLQAVALCDHVIDVGPGAGRAGGKVLFSGTPRDLLQKARYTSQTAQALGSLLQL